MKKSKKKFVLVGLVLLAVTGLLVLAGCDTTLEPESPQMEQTVNTDSTGGDSNTGGDGNTGGDSNTGGDGNTGDGGNTGGDGNTGDGGNNGSSEDSDGESNSNTGDDSTDNKTDASGNENVPHKHDFSYAINEDTHTGECICGTKLPVVDLTSQAEGSTVDITQDSVIIGDGNEYNVSLNIAEDATVTFDVGAGGVQLLASITVADTKTLTLLVAGDAEHTVNGGISLGNGSNVIIEGDLTKPNNKLTVTAAGGNAGIGANNGVTAGDITIRNARIDATGSSRKASEIHLDASISGAAIGTSDGSMGDILIENSIIVAAGGYYEKRAHAAAIGMGYFAGTMGNIIIKDSKITATNNGDGLASVIGGCSQAWTADDEAGTLGDIIITNTDLNLSMKISTTNCYAAIIGSGGGNSHAYVNMGKIIFTDVTQAALDAIIPTWLPSDFNEWGAYALGRGYEGIVYKCGTFGGVWVSDGNGGTVQIGNESGYYCLNEAIQ